VRQGPDNWNAPLHRPHRVRRRSPEGDEMKISLLMVLTCALFAALHFTAARDTGRKPASR
jgi:hypothetical protein